MSEYRVALDVYDGPLDLLLYLIRREEVDIHDIPIAKITEQYVAYVELLEEIDPERVGEFLVLAASLMETKSRMLLPSPPPEEADDDMTDPRVELVRQLLEYKKFKDAAFKLDQAAAVQLMKYPRAPVLPPSDEDEMDLSDIDLWDLFHAFNRLLEQTGQGKAVHRVGIDDTPISLHAADIADSLERAGGSQVFEDIFQGRSRPEMIGLFLAILELMRQRRIRITQDESLGTIWIHLLDTTPLDEIVDTEPESSADEYSDEEVALSLSDDVVQPKNMLNSTIPESDPVATRTIEDDGPQSETEPNDET